MVIHDHPNLKPQNQKEQMKGDFFQVMLALKCLTHISVSVNNLTLSDSAMQLSLKKMLTSLEIITETLKHDKYLLSWNSPMFCLYMTVIFNLTNHVLRTFLLKCSNRKNILVYTLEETGKF